MKNNKPTNVPDTSGVFRAVDEVFAETEKLFTETSRTAPPLDDASASSPCQVVHEPDSDTVTVVKLRFCGRWKTCWYFVRRAVDALWRGKTMVAYKRHAQPASQPPVT